MTQAQRDQFAGALARHLQARLCSGLTPATARDTLAIFALPVPASDGPHKRGLVAHSRHGVPGYA